MRDDRPILISVVQYQEAWDAGRIDIGGMIAAAHRHGADGLEIRPEFWRDKETELPAARDAAARHGLMLTYATFNAYPLFDAAAGDTLRQDIKDARALGAALWRVFPGAVPPADDAAGWARGAAIARDAAERGVTVAVENYARTPGGTLAEVQATLAALPTLRTNVDIGNYTGHGEDVPGAIRTLGDRVIAAHLKDRAGADTALGLGEGEMPLGAILAAFDALPQRVIYCFEFAGGPDPDARIAASMDYVRRRERGGHG